MVGRWIRKVMHRWASGLALASSFTCTVWASAPTPARAEGSWVVVGVRQVEDETPVAPWVAAAREALATVLDKRGEGRLAEGDGGALREQPLDWLEIETWLDAAEAHFYQLQVDEAERRVRAALDALRGRLGANVQESLRRGHALLASLVALEEGEDLGAQRERARASLEPLVRVHPELPTDARLPDELLALWQEAIDDSRRAPQGWLRVDCETPCPDAVVWADSFPIGPVGQSIPLAVGTYRVAVSPLADEARRGALRLVELRSGEEVRVTAYGDVERAIDPRDPGAFLLDDATQEKEAARFAAERLGAAKVLGVALRDEGTMLRLAGWGADGRQLFSRSLPLDRAEAELEAHLAEALGGKELDRNIAAELPPLAPSVEAPVRSSNSGWLSAARWSGTTLAIAAFGVGGWLQHDTLQRRDALPDLQLARGHFATVERAQAYDAEVAALRRQQDWSTGLLVGATALSVGTLILFLIEE